MDALKIFVNRFHYNIGAGNHHRGYVLAATLVVIAVAAVITVACARSALQLALVADDHVGELQRRWGMLSCQAVLLPEAEKILVAQEQRSGMPAPSVQEVIQLGGQSFTVTLGDEQAKANAALLVQLHGEIIAREILDHLLLGNPIATHLRLRPDGSLLPASFGRIFDISSPAQLLSCPIGAQSAASMITCWGNGKVNFRRANLLVLTAICVPPLDGESIGQLIESQAEVPQPSLSVVMSRLTLEQNLRAKAQALLADGSSCHSLWIVCQDQRRAWHRLAIDEDGDAQNGINEPSVFQW